MPWGIMRGAYTPGASYPLQIDRTGSPQSGALDVPYVSGCAGANGSSDYRDLINGSKLSCPLQIGQVLTLQSGSINGPTTQGIDQRIPIEKPADQIVSFDSSGNATILDPNSKQLVIIPIIENVDGTTNWPSGSGAIRIVGFAYFVVTGYGGNGQRLWVNGVFVSINTPLQGSDAGAWSHLPGGATTVALTN
jgi:hypothetical protein